MSFYTCFANAWVALVPWLKEHRDLDQLSDASCWHNQNQPIEVLTDARWAGFITPLRCRQPLCI